MILYMYIAPGQGQKTPWGQTFDVNRKPLSFRPFVASFKQISLNSDFIHIFSSNFKIWRKKFRVVGKIAHFQKIKDRTFTPF